MALEREAVKEAIRCEKLGVTANKRLNRKVSEVEKLNVKNP
jgi:hypothetical protein